MTTAPTTSPTDTLAMSAEDRRRARCVTCGCAAHVCRYSRWTIGKHTGVALYYFCRECDPEQENEREEIAA